MFTERFFGYNYYGGGGDQIHNLTIEREMNDEGWGVIYILLDF